MLRRYQDKDRGSNSSGTMQIHRAPSYAAIHPSSRSRDVVCIFCKHRFYIGRDLMGSNCPLLLPCGHATCSDCECSKPNRPCPLCPEYNVMRKRLPYNMYVVGLLHAINSTSIHVEDPDVSFHMPNKSIAAINVNQDYCKECGALAKCMCLNCNIALCNVCFKKLHTIALQHHEVISLNQNVQLDLQESDFCSKHPTYPTEYFCINCEINCCPECLIMFHKNHDFQKQVERNEAFMPEFYEAVNKLQETKMRISHTKKYVINNISNSEMVKKLQAAENQITQHFIYLHGVLQNAEQQLKDKLHKHRADLEKNLENLKDILIREEEKIASAISVATSIEANTSCIDIKKFTEQILILANTPCHLVERDDYDETIRMEIDKSVFDSIKQHVELHVPDVPRFNLVTTDDLPETYELEPFSADETMNSSCRMLVRKDMSSSFVSVASNNSSNPTFDCSLSIEQSNVEKGILKRVKVTHINNPLDFYVQKAVDIEHLDEIESDMAKYADKTSETPEEIFTNRIYVVLHSTELKWYRGRVMKIEEAPNSETTYEVFSIDYGMIEHKVSIDRIRKMQPQFSLITRMAIHCSLCEIAPANGDWDDTVIAQFRKMVACNTLLMKVIRSDDPTYIIDLVRFSNNKISISIRDWLIDTKLAKPITYFKLQRMNPSSAQQFYPDTLPLEKYSRVDVSYVQSPSCIYVKKRNIKDYQEVTMAFKKQFREYLEGGNRFVKNPEYGNTVAVKNASGWQRGTITKIIPEEFTLHVFLVDIGSIIITEYSKVVNLPSRFCTWNAQAIKVNLIDIKPLNTETWSTETINYLKSNIEGKHVKIIPFSVTQNTYNSCIYIFNDINVNANLVSMNFAESTGKHSKHISLNKEIVATPKKSRKTKGKQTTGQPKKNRETAVALPKKKIIQKVEEVDPFMVRVNINKIVSPDAIYVNEVSNVNVYKDMTNQMQRFYKTNQCPLQDELQPNLYYCVYSHKDKQYCRAQLVDMIDFYTARMSLVDLAEIETINLRDIQPLDSKFMKCPKYIFKVKIAGIRPCAGSKFWQSSCCDYLKDLINDAGDSKYYITLVSFPDADETLPVNLCIRRNLITGPTEPNKKETVSVARCLIDEGLALPIRGYNENAVKELAIELKKKLLLVNSSSENTRKISDNSATLITNNLPLNEVNDIVDDLNEENEEVNEEYSKEEEEILTPTNVSDKSISLTSKLNDWIPAKDLTDNEFEAVFSYVDYDCTVYFHPKTEEYNETLHYINETLYKRYNNYKSFKKHGHTWNEGDICIVNYHHDSKWYRGRVAEVVDHQTLRVYMVDYGNTEFCNVSNVRKEIILDDIPIQRIKANILGIQPVGERKYWDRDDLDMLHFALCELPYHKVKIVSKPPDPLTVIIWIIDNSKLYPLPWYIKNKTQIKCRVDDYSEYYNENGNATEDLAKDFIKNEPVIISINDKNSNDSFSDDEFEINSANNVFNKSSSIGIDSEEESCNTLKNNTIVTPDATIQTAHANSRDSIFNSLSKKLSEKTSSKSSTVSSFLNNSLKKTTVKNIEERNNLQKNCNGHVDIKKENNSSIDSFHDAVTEKLLSGSSAILDDDFNNVELESIKSVKTDDINNDAFTTSTPLDTSFLENLNLNEDIPKSIDFFKYRIRSFVMSIGEVFSGGTKMSGYIVDSPDEELNKWIQLCNNMQDDIQHYAEKQPIFDAKLGRFCIAKYYDGRWYRAFVLKRTIINGKEGVFLEFVDFGNRITVFNNSHIRAMRKEWINNPCMSFHFQLHNVKIVSQNDVPLVLHSLNDIFSQNLTYTAVIKKYDPELEIELYLDEDCKHLIYAPLIKDRLFKIIDSKVD